MRLRELPGPRGAPTVVLLHGWNATADLNFFRCYRRLGEHARVLAFDQRGHGHGIRSRRAFRLEDCADDVAALAELLDIGPIIPVGYSMGGAVAQLVWRRHPEQVLGLVLCATARHFNDGPNERLSFLGIGGLAALARLTPSQARRWISTQFFLQRKTETWAPWAVEEIADQDWRMVLEAGRALGTFRSDTWIGAIDVPVSVVVPMHDEVVPVRRQLALANAIPHARLYDVDAGHDAAIARPDRFMPALLEAVRSAAG